jgi:hypothetical protein
MSGASHQAKPRSKGQNRRARMMPQPRPDYPTMFELMKRAGGHPGFLCQIKESYRWIIRLTGTGGQQPATQMNTRMGFLSSFSFFTCVEERWCFSSTECSNGLEKIDSVTDSTGAARSLRN